MTKVVMAMLILNHVGDAAGRQFPVSRGNLKQIKEESQC